MIDQITPEEAVLADLPSFVDLENLDARGIDANFWRVDESRDHDADIMRGEILADQALAYCRLHSNPTLIGFTLRSIVFNGRMGPLECGFIGRIATAAAVGSHN